MANRSDEINIFVKSNRGNVKKYKSILSQCKTMKKNFVVSRIEASQDGSPYVYVSLTDPNDYKAGTESTQNPFGPNMMAFTSPEDLMKNLPKAMGNLSKAIGGGGALTDSQHSKSV
jgi:hypothetical protein